MEKKPEKTPAPTQEYLAPLRSIHWDAVADVRNCLHDAIGAQDEFRAVIVLAVVLVEPGYERVRMYSSSMGHLEKLGLLEKGKLAV